MNPPDAAHEPFSSSSSSSRSPHGKDSSEPDHSPQQGQAQSPDPQPLLPASLPASASASASASSSSPPSQPPPPLPPVGVPAHSAALTLPPISTIYHFVSADTASAPERFPQRCHNHRPYRDADQASFNTWTSPPPAAHYSASGQPFAGLAGAGAGAGAGAHAGAGAAAGNNGGNNDSGDERTAREQDNANDDDDNDDDDERAFDDDYDDDDTNFVFAHGRRYHASNGGRAFYPLPNDELEQERDDMKHNLALWMMHDKLFYAPVDEALRRGGAVFDLGTGTGTWAMELAKIYTTSQIHGCDLSPIQPAYVWDNVFFATGDFEDAATWDEYPDGAFDYIHMRYTLFAVQDPAALIQRAWKYLKPGGYLEFQEVLYWPQADDNTLSPETPYAFRDFCYYMQQALARLTSPGMDLFAINRVAELMRTVRASSPTPSSHTQPSQPSQPPPPPLFNDITEVRHKLPIGRWPASRRQREKGIWFLRMVILEGLGAIAKRAFVTGLGWTEVQVEMFLFEVRRSLLEWDGGGGGGGGGRMTAGRERGMGMFAASGGGGAGAGGVHAYLPFTVVYGRKPLEDGSAAVGGHDVVMGGA